MTQNNPELVARLALLVEETPEFESGLRRLGGYDPFVAILDLIDQTVIPAVLEITHGERVFLIEVSGRRICRLPGLVEELTASDPETLSDAALRIAEFADSAEKPLRVRELPSDAAHIDPAQSVSISAIAAAAGRPLIDPNMPPLGQIRARLGDAIVAAVTVEAGKVVDRSGDADLCAQLEKDQKSLTALAAEDAPGMVIFELDPAKPSLHGIVFVQRDALLFATAGVKPAQIVAAYDRSVNG